MTRALMLAVAAAAALYVGSLVIVAFRAFYAAADVLKAVQP